MLDGVAMQSRIFKGHHARKEIQMAKLKAHGHEIGTGISPRRRNGTCPTA